MRENEEQGAIEENELQRPGPTHIIMFWKSQNQEMLFRASDGICIGQCKDQTLIFGDQPNKRNSHVFIDADHARLYLRTKIAEADLKATATPGPVVIEDRDGEPTIVLPEGVMDLPVTGMGRKLN